MNERARIEHVYDGYASDQRYARRWDPDDPGNAAMEAERLGTLRSMVQNETGMFLDIGCGNGRFLAEWAQIWTGEVVGLELLADRAAVAGALHRRRIVRADAIRLPFRSRSVDAISLFTVMSSIIDARVRDAVATEVDRVLRPGGLVVWI